MKRCISFFIFENRVAIPLIQLKLLKIRNVLLANLITIVTGMANFLVFFGVVYYAELPVPFGLGFDAFATGLTLAPGTIVFACEFILETFDGPILERDLDETTGLYLWAMRE